MGTWSLSFTGLMKTNPSVGSYGLLSASSSSRDMWLNGCEQDLAFLQQVLDVQGQGSRHCAQLLGRDLIDLLSLRSNQVDLPAAVFFVRRETEFYESSVIQSYLTVYPGLCFAQIHLSSLHL